jgi:AraC-like DNA-binding protein
LNTKPFFLASNIYENKSGDSINVRHEMNAHSFPLHRHEYVEMIYVIRGSGTHIVNGNEHLLCPGSLSIIFPWQAHEYQCKDPVELINVQLSMEVFNNTQLPLIKINNIFFAETDRPSCVYLDNDSCGETEKLFRKLEDEYTQQRLLNDVVVFSIILQILVIYERLLDPQMKHANRKDVQESGTVWKAIEYINRHFGSDVSIEDAASYANISVGKLKTDMKSVLGISFFELVQEVRLRNACALLNSTILSVEEIASKSGYQNANTFEKVFKKTKGLSPEKYRRIDLCSQYVHSIIKNIPDSASLFYDLVNNPEGISHASLLSMQIRLYIFQHFNEDITLKRLAKNFYYSESYLSDLLAKNNINFIEILKEVRIRHAVDLILTTSIPIIDIGFAVGFNSTETFMRTFKKLKGVSPGKFRKAT